MGPGLTAGTLFLFVLIIRKGFNMKPSDYEFAVGDKVVTIYGEVGHIVYICRCDRCLERGFRELTWRSDIDHDVNWITIYDA